MYTTSKDETEEERRRRLDAVVDAYDGPDAGEEEVLRGDPEYIPPVEAPTPAAPVSPREPDYSSAEDALDEADRADRIERDREDAWAVERGDRALAESRAMAAELDARVRSRTPAPVDPANRAARAAMREAERRAAEERRAEGDRLGREATALYEEAPPGLSADLGRVYEMDPRFAPGPASGDIRALLADPVPRPDVPTAVDGGRHVAPGVKGGSLPKRGGDLPTTTGDAMAASVERGPLPIPEEVPSWEAGEVPTDTDPAREAAEFVRGLDLSGLEGGVSEALADASGYVAPHGEPDADEMGGPPDMDADDLGTTGAAMERSAERAAEVRPERARWEAVTDPWDGPSSLESDFVPQAAGDADMRAEEWYGPDDAVPQAPGEADVLMAEHTEPDADEAGGPPDGDADDGREVAIDWGDEAEAPLNETPDVSTTPFDDGSGTYAEADPDVPPGADPTMDPMWTWSHTPNEDEPVSDMVVPGDGLMSEEDAFAGPAPSRDDETWGMATDEDPTYPAADHSEPDADEMGGPSDMDADDAAAMAAKVPSGTSGPPADDFTGADWSDAIRGSIGGLLQALSGRGVTPVRSERAEMEERIAARNTAKGAATRAYETREARSADRAADRASREAMAAERADIARTESARDYELGARRADTGATNAAANAAATESLVETRGATRARTDAMMDADSEVSASARERLRSEIELLPPEARDVAREAFAERNWTAADVEQIEEEGVPNFGRSYLARRAGRGGAAGGGRAEAQIAELERLGIPRSTTAALSGRARDALLRDLADETSGHETRLEGGGRPEGGTAELVDGVWSTISFPSPSAAAASSRAYREGWGATRESFNALDRIESVINRPGLATLDRAALGEISADLMTLRSLAARTQGTGVINPTEMPAIDAAIPNPADLVGTATGSLRSRLESWRNAALRGVMLGARDLGVSDEGVARLRSGLSGRGYSGRATTDDVTGEPLAGAPMDEVSTEERYVTMRSPSGLEVEVPEDEVERFVSMGAEVVDGP